MKDIASIGNLIYTIILTGGFGYIFNVLLKKLEKIDELEKRIIELEFKDKYLRKDG